LGRDIEVASATLRIRLPYLQAIEDGRFGDLPGATYAIGFVRGYAEYLGLDGNEIVRRFKQEHSDLAGRSELVFPSAVSGGGIPTGALLGFAVIGAAIAYGLWYWYQAREESVAEAVPPLPERLAALIHKPVGAGDDAASAPNEAAKPADQAPAAATGASAPHDDVIPSSDEETAAANRPPAAAPPLAAADGANAPAASPMPAEVLPTKPGKAAKSKAAKAEPPNTGAAPPPAEVAEATAAAPVAAAPPPQVAAGPSSRVLLRADDNCWIKIRDTTGQVVMSRLLHKGDSFSPPNRPGLSLTVGNAGALTILVDGKATPPLGVVGAVRHDLPLDPDRLGGGPAPDSPVGE
jgi:cytoskeleton protein RodZ